jgi:hypothetical protein
VDKTDTKLEGSRHGCFSACRDALNDLIGSEMSDIPHIEPQFTV